MYTPIIAGTIATATLVGTFGYKFYMKRKISIELFEALKNDDVKMTQAILAAHEGFLSEEQKKSAYVIVNRHYNNNK